MRPIGIDRQFVDRHRALAENHQCTLVKCDLSVIDEIMAVDLSKVVSSNATELAFVNNAGTIEPIAQIADRTPRQVNR